MASGIHELDRLAVGYVEKYGNPWHMHPNCMNFEGEIPIETAKEIFDYEVEKVQLVIPELGIEVPGAYALIRKDTVEDGEVETTVLYPSVGQRYVVTQNSTLLEQVEIGLLIDYDLPIESIGTLFNGQKAFINIILDDFQVPGDESPTVTRIMVSNSFGGDSYQSCIHTTRIVCDNTLRLASMQGKVNKSLRKFRHTKHVLDRIEDHMIDLTEIAAEIKEHNNMLTAMAKKKMSSDLVEKFLDGFIELPEKDGKGKTMRKRRREEIIGLFEDKDDLQGGISRTLYAMLQAVTDWADHLSPVYKGDDVMGRFWDGIWGSKDQFKQDALKTAIKILKS
ncbi:MAG: DUF932 domain-containing protein [bacterium]